MRILPGGDDQVHLWRQMLQQKRESLVHRFGVDDMVVVEDEDDTVRESRDLVEQGRQHRFDRWRLGRLEHAQHPFPNIRRNRPQGGDEVGQEARGIVVAFVQGQPGGRPVGNLAIHSLTSVLFPKPAEAETSVSLRSQALVQPLDQAGADNDSRRRRRDIELGGEDRRRHGAIIGHNP